MSFHTRSFKDIINTFTLVSSGSRLEVWKKDNVTATLAWFPDDVSVHPSTITLEYE